MCKFKSGIITKNGVTLAPMYNDSHSKLLEVMGIKDNEINAMKKFVRAELVIEKDILQSIYNLFREFKTNLWTFMNFF